MTIPFYIFTILVITFILGLILFPILKKRSLMEILGIAILFVLVGGFTFMEDQLFDDAFRMFFGYGMMLIGLLGGIIAFIVKQK